jgi:hypothetical protein
VVPEPLTPPVCLGENDPFPCPALPSLVSISANTPLSTADYAESIKPCISTAGNEVKKSNGAISFTVALDACVKGL